MTWAGLARHSMSSPAADRATPATSSPKWTGKAMRAARATQDG